MFEKVNPAHPDKVADRIAGAIVDYCYSKQDNPKVAVEVLIGHKIATVLIESSVRIPKKEVKKIITRIAGLDFKLFYKKVRQDPMLADNQLAGVRSGDNGIFKGSLVTDEQKELTKIATDIYTRYLTDGKYIIDGEKLVICQSCALDRELIPRYSNALINPIGWWSGGLDVDSGATNRKLGSDMGNAVTGGGLHGKDLSKGDVSVNIYAHLKAMAAGIDGYEISTHIGATAVDGRSYSEIVEIANKYIKIIGSFEEFAEWGLIRELTPYQKSKIDELITEYFN